MKRFIHKLWLWGEPVRSRSDLALAPPDQRVTGRTACYLGILLVLSWLPMLLGRGVVARVAAMYELSAAAHPYFQPSHAGLLYVLTPLVVASSFVLFLSPGGLWVLALGQARRWVEFVALAFGASLLALVGLTTIAKLVLGPPLAMAVFLGLWLGCAGLAWLVLALRVWRGEAIAWPVSQLADLRRAAWTLAVPAVAVICLLPKIFWENFSQDGIEAFEFGRSLISHLLPYWDLKDAAFGFYHNYLLFAYPNYWFITLFGPVEAAARLPFALYLTVLFAVLLLLIEYRALRPLRGREEAVLLLGLATFAVVIGYNGSYDLYLSDIAEPAAPDALLIICFLGATYFFLVGRVVWFWVFALMAYMAGPAGFLLLVLLGSAMLLWRPKGSRRQLITIGKLVLVCGLLGLAYELIYNPLVLGGVDVQFSAKNLLRRIIPPDLGQFARINFLLFPSGILPALALAAIRWQDATGRVLSTVTLAYFGVIYSQSWTSLHQFAPIMVLPLAVFWPLYLRQSVRFQKVLLPITALSALAALWLSLPQHFQINQAHREFGYGTLYCVGDYEKGYPLALRHSQILYELIPGDWKLDYPHHRWGMDHQTWIYYATRSKPPGTFINYIVQAAADPPPAHFEHVRIRDGVAVYVRDFDLWQRHLSRQLPPILQSPLYEPVLRETYRFFRAYMEMARRKEPE